MAKSDKYKSQICIGGKRRGDMEGIIRSIFGESFLNVELTKDNQKFVIRIAIYNEDDHKKIIDLQSNPKYALCVFVAFKPVELDLKYGNKK